MRITPAIAGLALAALAVSPLSAKNFEGEITYKMSAKNKSQDMTYALKGNKARMDMTADNGKKATMIMDIKDKSMLMLMHEKKMYMLHQLPDVKDKPKGDKKKHEMEKTGKTEEIAGYKCEEYLSKDENGETEIWVTKGLGMFFMGNGGPMGGGAPSAWEKEAREKGFFPLRMVHRESGKESMRMEATRVEKKSLDASLFAAPSDYKKMDMGGMGGGPMGGGRPAGMPSAEDMMKMSPEERQEFIKKMKEMHGR